MPANSILLPVMSAVMPKAPNPILISGNAQPQAIAAVRANTTTHTGRWKREILVCFIAAKLQKKDHISLFFSENHLQIDKTSLKKKYLLFKNLRQLIHYSRFLRNFVSANFQINGTKYGKATAK
jgi:hypothetical protein